MPLHLLKLCVGIESVDELRRWTLLRAQKSPGAVHAHVTRMRPSRDKEVLDGGSLYWVIKGQISVRQKLIGLEDFVDSAGVRRCALQLDDEIVAVAPRPCRAFQGWRYLKAEDAPPDLTSAGADMPEALRRELSALGLL
ncbi:hypothetical protein M2323_000880 [Rhodoblastus acidophilus]|uniref:DUF1489 family protein n=1 Tax=Rhodoblastus acidophilus TaxID=1074 RepID=UPI002224F4C6|nr:DUF1489 domain-containing protein [Rhodoblastus acidophilus]MCW2282973.1 hypothetical protein [Rhodoblastus acidophilus]MCW2331976.1 hypothetical protein [Rhodoblastus acidophilus]